MQVNLQTHNKKQPPELALEEEDRVGGLSPAACSPAASLLIHVAEKWEILGAAWTSPCSIGIVFAEQWEVLDVM